MHSLCPSMSVCILRGGVSLLKPRTIRAAGRSASSHTPRFGRHAVHAMGSAAPLPKRVLVPIATGSEEIETACIVDILRRAGADVTLASVEASLTVAMSRGMRFVADQPIVTCATVAPYDLIALPGGMPGASRLAADETLQALLKAQAERGALYAAMCAAPAEVLEPLGLLAGRAATAHPAFVEKLANHASASARVVVDRGCITSRGPGTALVRCFHHVSSFRPSAS